MSRKICVVITARPSYARIKTALKAINNHPDLELQLVVAASALLDKYGNAVVQIEKDGFQISEKVFTIVEGENLVTTSKSTGLGIIELSTVFDKLRPDAIVTIADRFETISTAIAASYMNIPLVHIQGGEVTGSIDEKVRHAITKLSDIHFVASIKAAERVTKMGEDPARVFITGCPSIDIADTVLKEKPKLDFQPPQKYGGVGSEFDAKSEYIVVMQHPVTTENFQAREQVLETLQAINDLKINTFWFWPNVDAGSDETAKGIRMFRETREPSNIWFFKNMSPEDFLKLVYNSKCMVGNSSVAIRECSYLGIPAVNIGSRQTGRERGQNVIDVGHNRDEIKESIKKHLDHGFYETDTIYGDGKAGEKIASLLSSIPLSFTKMLTY